MFVNNAIIKLIEQQVYNNTETVLMMSHYITQQCGYETSQKTELKKLMRTFLNRLKHNCVQCDQQTGQRFGVQHVNSNQYRIIQDYL